jgi:hypothetical protein
MGSADYFTILGYSIFRYQQTKENKYRIYHTEAQNLGKQASILCRKRGFKIGQCRDPQYGIIGTYPKEILDEVFDQYFKCVTNLPQFRYSQSSKELSYDEKMNRLGAVYERRKVRAQSKSTLPPLRMRPFHKPKQPQKDVKISKRVPI